MRASAGEFGLIIKPLNLVVFFKKKNKIKNPLLSLSDGQRTALIRSSGSRRPLGGLGVARVDPRLSS